MKYEIVGGDGKGSDIKFSGLRVEQAFGLLIQFNNETMHGIHSAIIQDAEEKAEVRVDYYGQIKDFTLDEFLTKLDIRREK